MFAEQVAPLGGQSSGRQVVDFDPLTIMKVRRHGRIINIGSILSIVGLPGRSPHAASKGSVLQLARTLALEWATAGITVNAMDLPLLKDPEIYQEFVAQLPMGRIAEPEELKGLTVFLASDASSFVTGAGITIDGGMTAR